MCSIVKTNFDTKVHKNNEHFLCIVLVDGGAHMVYNKMKEVITYVNFQYKVEGTTK